MIVNYIDPKLAGRGGHYLDWCVKVLEELRQSTCHQIRVYTQNGIAQDVRQEIEEKAEVIPLFRKIPDKIAEGIDRVAEERAFLLEASQSMARELLEVEQADIWLWPTLFEYQLAAIAMAPPNCPVSGCIHFPPDVGVRRNMWRMGSIAARKEGLDLRLGVTVPELVPLYSRLMERQVDVMPIMVEGARAGGTAKTQLKRIGFFGHQRPEKGLGLFPKLISRLYAKGYELVVHDSGKAIRGVEAPRLKFLSYAHSLADEIAQCDLVVVPYRPERYRARASGIAWEAISRGVPVVTPAETSPGSLTLETGAGVIFGEFNVESICAAVEVAHERYAEIAQAAFEASQDWSRLHGSDRFIEAMLAGVSHAEPSAMTGR